METGSTPTDVETAAPARVYIVDSYPLIRRGLKELIGGERDMRVCGEAEEGGTAFRAITELRPDIVLVEIALHGNSGLELIKNVRSFAPQIRLLVVSMHDEFIYAPRAMRAGARGFVSKHAAADQVLEAIRRVRRGGLCFSPDIESEVLARIVRGRTHGFDSPISGLSDRELEIGALIGASATTREIAARLRLSIKTVESHRSHLKEKLGLRNGTRLLQFWVSWIAGSENPAARGAAANDAPTTTCARPWAAGESSTLLAEAGSPAHDGDAGRSTIAPNKAASPGGREHRHAAPKNGRAAPGIKPTSSR